MRSFSFVACAALAISTLVLPTNPAAAILVARWDMSGNAGTEASEIAAFTDPNLSAAVLARGPFLTGSAAANSLSATGFLGSDPGAYFSLSFIVDGESFLDLETLSIGTRSSATGPGTIGVFTSADAFAAPITTISQALGGNFVNSVIDLSLLPTFSGEFEIRFAEVGDTQADGVGATASTGTFRIADHFIGVEDFDIQLMGAISAVPEASALLFGGLVCGVVGLKVAGRRRVAIR